MIERLAHLYGVDLYDYGEGRSDGLAISNGSGGMLAAMDSIPVRWAWLLEKMGGGERTFAEAAAVGIGGPVVVWVYFGWGMDDPAEWSRILEPFGHDRVWIHTDLEQWRPWRCYTRLGDLVIAAQTAQGGAHRIPHPEPRPTRSVTADAK